MYEYKKNIRVNLVNKEIVTPRKKFKIVKEPTIKQKWTKRIIRYCVLIGLIIFLIKINIPNFIISIWTGDKVILNFLMIIVLLFWAIFEICYVCLYGWNWNK